MVDEPPKRRPGTVIGPRNEDRRATPARGLAVVIPPIPAPRGEDFERPITGVDMEPLAAIEARQQRLQRTTESAATSITTIVSEHGRDIRDLKDDVAAVRIDVAGMRGELRVLPELVDVLKDATRASDARKTMTLTTELKVDEATKLDVIDGRKANRKNVALVLGGIFSTATLTALITLAASHC